MNLNNTAHKILDTAEYYTQIRGFNAFSYKDIQEKVGIKTSSIHYYFPTKQDLSLAIIKRYSDNFENLLNDIIKKNESGIQSLKYLGEIYIDSVKDGKFCMCGMLASDLYSLTDLTNITLQKFFKLNLSWIEIMIEKAKKQGEVLDSIDSQKSSNLFFAALEGGMLIARSQKNTCYLEDVIEQAIAQIKQ